MDGRSASRAPIQAGPGSALDPLRHWAVGMFRDLFLTRTGTPNQEVAIAASAYGDFWLLGSYASVLISRDENEEQACTHACTRVHTHAHTHGMRARMRARTHACHSECAWRYSVSRQRCICTYFSGQKITGGRFGSGSWTVMLSCRAWTFSANLTSRSRCFRCTRFGEAGCTRHR